MIYDIKFLICGRKTAYVSFNAHFVRIECLYINPKAFSNNVTDSDKCFKKKMFHLQKCILCVFVLCMSVYIFTVALLKSYCIIYQLLLYLIMIYFTLPPDYSDLHWMFFWPHLTG